MLRASSSPIRVCLVLVLTFALPPVAQTANDPATTLTDAERNTLLEMLKEGKGATEGILTQAEGDLFSRRPGENRWSVAEVLEHITATEELLFGMATSALSGDADPEWQQLVEKMPVDRFADIIRSRAERFQAPEAVHPKGDMGREALVARYQAARAKTEQFIRTTDASVKDRTAMGPAGKITVHHLLTLIAAHNLRHNEQMREVLGQLAPGGAPE